MALSDRSVLEFDRAHIPSGDPVALLSWAMALRAYLAYNDVQYLPPGVTAWIGKNETQESKKWLAASIK